MARPGAVDPEELERRRQEFDDDGCRAIVDAVAASVATLQRYFPTEMRVQRVAPARIFSTVSAMRRARVSGFLASVTRRTYSLRCE